MPVTMSDNCIPYTLTQNGKEVPRGSSPRTHRLAVEAATQFYGIFAEQRALLRAAPALQDVSPYLQKAHDWVFAWKNLSPVVREDDLIVGGRIRGDVSDGGWMPNAGDHLISMFTRLGPQEPVWVRDMSARGLISPANALNHKVADWDGFLRVGSQRLIDRALELQKDRTGEAWDVSESYVLLHGAFISIAQAYADRCRAIAKTAFAERSKELEEIARICEWVPANPARTFHEAVQMYWFAYMFVGDGLGRPDQFLYEYYKADIAAGRITPERALELVECLMIKMQGECAEGICNVSSIQTLTLGGVDSQGNDACNELTMAFLQAIRNIRLPRPTVYLRCHDKTPQEYLAMCVAMLGDGLGEPNFYGDAPIIEGLVRLGVPLEEARNYALSGCTEVVSPGKGNWGAPSGWINISLLADEALREAARTNAGEAGFKEILNRLYDEVVEACCITNAHLDARGMKETRPVDTIMFFNCLETGKNIMTGGADSYYGHWEMTGLPNAADMIYSAYTVGFDKLEETFAAIDAGDEDTIRALRKLPKFGNDFVQVDEIAASIVEELSKKLEARSVGMRKALCLGHLSGGENLHVTYGKIMGATLDGRRPGEALGDSLAGGQGRTKGGPTAVIQSLCKLDHSRLQAGNVSTMRLSVKDFDGEHNQKKIAALLRTFVALGGSQIQLNRLDPELLRKAQLEPENHAGIIVRVAGYSAEFTHCEREVQDEIIARTEGMN